MKCIAVCVTKSNRSVITDKDTEKCKQYYLKMKRLLISILSQLLIKCDMLTCNIYGKKTQKTKQNAQKNPRRCSFHAVYLLHVAQFMLEYQARFNVCYYSV